MERGGGGGAAPTGCYKCGRPGHWSRDCLSHPSNGNNPNSASTSLPNTFASNRRSTPDASNSGAGGSSLPKAKTVPRTRPKLTADSLLSDDGIGHILRHFPRAFKYHGSGHEVSDLGNLLGLYSDWHSRLLPYYSFDDENVDDPNLSGSSGFGYSVGIFGDSHHLLRTLSLLLLHHLSRSSCGA